MGERLNGDGVPGRRRAHPDGAMSDLREVRDAATVEPLLAAALRGGALDPEAEQRALTAFRAAHGAGAHHVRTRRRDDWRPTAERRSRRPARVTFGVVFASLTLGGVAVAAIGSAGSSTDGADPSQGTAHPSAVTADQPGDEASPALSGPPAQADSSASAQETEAHCRAYEQVEDRGRAIDARAWQQLVAAAGGKDKVAAYCSEHPPGTSTAPGRSAGAGKPGGTGTGAAGNTGASHSGTSGDNPGGTNKGAGTGRTSADPGSGKHK